MGDAKLSLVDLRDVAAVVAKVLTSLLGHPGKVYELNGLGAFSQAEIAQKISQVTG